MKKNILFRTAMCMSVATVLSLCMISGTYAKYVTAITGSADSARVAKFAFDITGGGSSSNKASQSVQTITVDLFNTVLDVSGTSAEDDIAASDGTLVCPGSWGYVEVKIENGSEVDIMPAFTISATPNGVPIKLCVVDTTPTSLPTGGGVTWIDISATLSDLVAGLNTQLDFKGGTTDSKSVFICWKWDYSATGADAGDTTLGIAGTATPSVTIGCTVTQVD